MGTALLLTPSLAPAGPVGTVVRDRDYTMVTAASQTGGDALYVIDNRRGLIAVLTYDNNSRSMSLRASAPVSDAFIGIRPGEK
jgi:hypothetical protein